jgi:HSP20 family protein
MIKEKIMRTLSTRTWNPLSLFDNFDNFFTHYYEKFDFMKTDIIERDNEYLIDVELPGFEKSDITVEYENKYLTVTAERKAKEVDGDKVLRRERTMSSKRSYYVDGIDESALKAKYDAGILTITLPKLQPKKPEKLGIEIE